MTKETAIKVARQQLEKMNPRSLMIRQAKNGQFMIEPSDSLVMKVAKHKWGLHDFIQKFAN